MALTVDPALVRNLADRIERLPDLINDPVQMFFVQDAIRVALEQCRADRDGKAVHWDSAGNFVKAEELGQPVTSVLFIFPDNVKQAIEEIFKQDETGALEEIERDAAVIAQWLVEFRHPRDAERFRESLKFVRDDIAAWPVLGVEVQPGAYELKLRHWEAEVAKPLCDYLRKLADKIAEESNTYSMSFDGRHWHVSYDNERGFVNDSKGARHVVRLLEHRGKVIPCHVLHNSIERELKKNDPAIGKHDAETEFALLRDELAELRRRMEEKPHEILPEDREEEEHILGRIQQLTGLGGRPRLKGEADAARTAVQKAVKRFFLACRKKKLDAFVDHLESKLVMGNNPVYNGSIEWKITNVTRDVTM